MENQEKKKSNLKMKKAYIWQLFLLEVGFSSAYGLNF